MSVEIAPSITEISLRDLRARRREREGPRPPLQYANRYDFHLAHYIRGDVDLSTQIAIESLDRNFEIIYDRAIAPTDSSPGHCLYRRIRNGGSPTGDYFVLEFPLQWECEKQWPHGRPREPGMWVVDEIKKRMAAKNAFGGDTLEKATENEVDSIVSANDANREKIRKSESELNRELAKDFTAFAVRGKQTVSMNPEIASSPHKNSRRKGGRQ